MKFNSSCCARVRRASVSRWKVECIVNGGVRMDQRASVPSNERLLLSIREAAVTLAISRTKLYELLSAEEISTVRIGRCVRISRAELLRFIDRQSWNG
jgi:excisionase family DNA binding protein